MMRYVAIGALCVALVAGGAAAYLMWRNGHLREDLSAAERALAVRERQLIDAQNSARELDAHISQMEEERRDMDATLRALRSREGYDAPLSDFLRDAYGRL